MAQIGYSGKPLFQKLGIKPDMKIRLIGAPKAYFDWLEADFKPIVVKSVGPSKTSSAKNEAIGLVHIFATKISDLAESFFQTIKEIPSDGIIWISWYKLSAKKDSDINEQAIRDLVLPTGWVDVKVCAVSEEWSGLKIVKRKELR
jgi:hypothetical protein